MSIRKILDGTQTTQYQKQVLGLEGQVVDILTDLPMGYEYKLHRLSNAMNSETVLLIVKKE